MGGKGKGQSQWDRGKGEECGERIMQGCEQCRQGKIQSGEGRIKIKKGGAHQILMVGGGMWGEPSDKKKNEWKR